VRAGDRQDPSVLSGHAFEIDFMQTFSRHHKSMIDASRPVGGHAYHEPLREMATMIIRMRTENILKMQS
jgi:uncharacterized protein (DUF305 family)